MHIPDGFLDLKTFATTTSTAGFALWAALNHTKRTLPERDVPLLGLSGAFIFAAQMINFPAVGGTSGHLVGSLLLAALLGPAAAVVVISSVLIIQCLLFADGGITALGANMLNMAIFGGVLPWLIYRTLHTAFPGRFGLVLAASFAGWTSSVLAAAACSLELASSGLAPWTAVTPVMVGMHMLIGIGEGLITALVLYWVSICRPALLDEGGWGRSANHQRAAVLVLASSIGAGVFLSPIGSTGRDALARAAEVLGFSEQARPLIPPLFTDGGSAAARFISVAGGIGTVAAFALAWLLAVLVTKKPSASPIN